jgi:hypothetical protein
VRIAGVCLLIGFVGAMALSACSNSSTPGVLTLADIPSYLDVTANSAATASEGRAVGTTPHCTKAGVVVFTVPGWRVPKRGLLTSANAPVVVSVDDVCVTSSDAHAGFTSDSGVGVVGPVPGIGNEATLLDLGSGPQRMYLVGWRKGNQFGAVGVLGSAKNDRITPALAELLARRVAARS